MSSNGATTKAHEWWFTLYPEVRPTQEQSDRFDHAESLASGEIGWEEDPQGVRFPCAVTGPRLKDSVLWAVERMGELGVRIASVKVHPGSDQAVDSDWTRRW